MQIFHTIYVGLDDCFLPYKNEILEREKWSILKLFYIFPCAFMCSLRVDIEKEGIRPGQNALTTKMCSLHLA